VIGVGVSLLLLWNLSMWFIPPARLGVVDGRLHDCPNSPNCVSSQASSPSHQIEPLRWSAEESAEAAWSRLNTLIGQQPRARVVTATDGYLHATFTSLMLRFVDDLECLLDRDAKLIHIRSASRVGYSDLGVNRKRVERLRKQFESLPR
jgi:uncharacterized protein (DUF1499 family)